MDIRKFYLGDVVVSKRPYGWREGTVVLVVPARHSARRTIKKLGLPLRHFDRDTPVRDHESYVVNSGGVLYHPSVWRIEKRQTVDDAQKMANVVMRRIVTKMGLVKKGGGK